MARAAGRAGAVVWRIDHLDRPCRKGPDAMESYYREQASSCAREAAATQLSQVRDRYRRSEEAWLAMADRIARTAAFKATNGA
jgi:hypothetical protein